MPLRWFLYDWLCAVWLVDFAMAEACERITQGSAEPSRRAERGGGLPRASCVLGAEELYMCIQKNSTVLSIATLRLHIW